MTIGLIGVKRGMTRVFTAEGVSIPVTVVEASPNRVTQRKTTARDGYEAIQVTTGSVHASRVKKPEAGHFAKAECEAGKGLWEFRLAGDEDFSVGDEIGVGRFTVGQKVDVTGQSKGKGFAGAVKKYHFKTQDATHGNSLSHRALGSVGQCQTPGRVFKGKKMAGQMGANRVTVQTLEVVQVDETRNLLLIKGAVPGTTGGDLMIRASVKA